MKMVVTFSFVCVVAMLTTSAYCRPENIQDVADPDKCSQCIQMVDYAMSLESDEAKEVVYKAICSSLSKDSDEDYCRRLFRKLTSRDACWVWGVCGSSSFIQENLDLFYTEVETRVSTGMCGVCKVAVGIGRAFLQNQDNQNLILGLIKSVCPPIPFINDACKVAIDSFGSLAINAVAELLDPQCTCNFLTLCPGGQELAMVGNECQICEMTMGIIHDILRDPTLGVRIAQVTEDLCNQASGFNSTCHSLGRDMSKTLLPVLRPLVLTGSFRDVCQMTDICPAE